MPLEGVPSENRLQFLGFFCRNLTEVGVNKLTDNGKISDTNSLIKQALNVSKLGYFGAGRHLEGIEWVSGQMPRRWEVWE